jgi:hypothetical protein
MNFADVHPDDPRWTEKERTVLIHLLRTRQRYINEKRRLEAHGVAKAVYVMANVLEAFDRIPTDSKTDPFQSLL